MAFHPKPIPLLQTHCKPEKERKNIKWATADKLDKKCDLPDDRNEISTVEVA